MLSNSIGVSSPSFESPPSSASLLFDDCERWLVRVRSLAPETARRRRLYLERFVLQSTIVSSERLLQWLSFAHLQGFVVDYARIYGPGSQKWMVDSLRGFLRFCHCRGYLSEDLSCAVPSRCNRRLARVPKSLDDESIEQLLASIDRGYPVGCRDAAVITLASTYGVRGIQLRTMKLDDIDWDAEQV
jgi:integrase/recombinase XerD